MTSRRKAIPARADALAVLRAWERNDPELRRMIVAERTNAAVARQIHEIRKARGLTQRQLADLVGTKQPVIARLEDPDYEGHSFATLSRIADALRCGLDVSFIPWRGTTEAAARRRAHHTRGDLRP